MIPEKELPLDKPSLQALEKEFTMKISKLSQTNEQLTENIQTAPYSEELREFYETIQENKEIIEKMTNTVDAIQVRLGV